jgi:hypothetical protein
MHTILSEKETNLSAVEPMKHFISELDFTTEYYVVLCSSL